MSIELPAAEVRALADTLRERAGDAEDALARLDGRSSVGGPLQAALDGFLESHRAAGRALAGELRWLGSTIEAVADSWVDLDAALLGRDRRVVPR
jgi:hypothetical protein